MFSVIPAIDILAGECVRLVRGDYGKVSVFGRDPAAVAARFADAGFRRLHVVDLDAARGDGDNVAAVRRIMQKVKGRMKVQTGGGLRSDAALENAADAGADFMIVGTAAATNRRWREKIIGDYPGRILLALDIRGDDAASAKVSVSGWREDAALTAADYLWQMRRLPPAGIVCTDINSDGVMNGPNLVQLRGIAEVAPCPVIASGGVRDVNDARVLAKIPNVCAAVVGRALYDSDAGAIAAGFLRAEDVAA